MTACPAPQIDAVIVSSRLAHLFQFLFVVLLGMTIEVVVDFRWRAKNILFAARCGRDLHHPTSLAHRAEHLDLGIFHKDQRNLPSPSIIASTTYFPDMWLILASKILMTRLQKYSADFAS
jgi:hypothetical protein